MSNWNNAQAYCAWAGPSTRSEQISLPTEAQWEKIARGGLEGKSYSRGGYTS
jgi:formylglycine-generating enzyme required for sulfatase activity